jgi:hypothetical protein
VDIIGRGFLHGLAQLFDELGVERISPLGTPQLNGQDVSDAVDTNHVEQPSELSGVIESAVAGTFPSGETPDRMLPRDKA